MDNENEVTSRGIAELFGVNKSNFSACVELIPDFPKPVRIEYRRRIYSLQAVKNWSEGKDAARIIRAAYARSRSSKFQPPDDDASASKKSISAMRLAFLSGRMGRS